MFCNANARNILNFIESLVCLQCKCIKSEGPLETTMDISNKSVHMKTAAKL